MTGEIERVEVSRAALESIRGRLGDFPAVDAAIRVVLGLMDGKTVVIEAPPIPLPTGDDLVEEIIVSPEPPEGRTVDA